VHPPSSEAILTDFIGADRTPLLILDHAASLRQRDVSARVAAALSLRPFATELVFLLAASGRPESVRWDVVRDLASTHAHLRVYGFTSILWQAWGRLVPAEVRSALRATRIDFVHSGGWKTLEAERVDRTDLDEALLRGLAEGSRVIDYYGLVEQVGMVYPLCEAGFRHVPVWADVIVRDPWTSNPLSTEIGMLQLLNVLAHGAPYHSVLTEDRGRIVAGDCACGRRGKRFALIGRVPKAEMRGCANV
jgi:hypothetical protein